jgi:hypothetical protein
MKQIIKILLALYCFNATALFAQDVIVLQSGDEIKAKVMEISPGEVKYKKHASPDGPTYTLTKSEVFMIKYENGEKEVFNSTTTSPLPVQSTPQGTSITLNAGINTVVVKKLPNWGKNYLAVMQIAPYSSACNAGLQTMDVITHIDGAHIYGLTEEDFYERTRENKNVRLSVFRKQDGKTNVLEITCNLCPWKFRGIPDYVYAYNGSIDLQKGARRWDAHNGLYAVKFTQYTDRVWAADSEIDFLSYNTFDFEYSNAEDPLKEKALAERLTPHLAEKGLKRDTENPDLLIALSFFEGKESTYIPPHPQFYTRYGTTYNIWTGRFELRQYLESSTAGNYTRNTYLVSLKICMLDAEKAKNRETKLPPIVWQNSMEWTYEKKPDFREVTNIMYTWNMYPFSEPYYYICDYNFYGLFFDEQGEISDIFPGSPADRAGMKPGDKIVALNGSNSGFDGKYSKIPATWVFVKGDYSLLRRENIGVVPLTVQRGRQKIDLQITPTPTHYQCLVKR